MSRYTLSHLENHVLLRDLNALVVRDRALTAELLAHLAETDARRLYLPAAYPSMFAWCVGELGFSEGAAYRRIRAARAAREFPALFEAIADGRLNLSAVLLLAPHLTRENVGELLAAAARRSHAQVEQMLAERFPQPDLATSLRALSEQASEPQLATSRVQGMVKPMTLCGLGDSKCQDSQAGAGAALIEMGAAPVAAAPASRTRIAPLAPQRYGLQVTLTQETHDLLRQAQALLAHAIPAGDVEQLLGRALRALVTQLERRKLAAAAKPRPARRPGSARTIPAAVRREVWKRDGGRCTFVGDGGRRCEERSRLEWDHVTPVARGGTATPSGIRLRCRAHNQYAAEQAYGVAFMRAKRDAARRRGHASPAAAP